MKKGIKGAFMKLFKPIANSLGYTNNEALNNGTSAGNAYDKNNLLHTFYTILKAAQFSPTHIVDVGANKGNWTRQALKEFPDCRFTLLEPQGWMKESIKDLLQTNANISFNAVGAGKQSGSFKFTIVDRDDSCSFNYSAEEAKKKGYTQVAIQVVTLNELISERHLPIPDIIKIDAEGLDIEVLEGASDFFGKTEVFMVEAGVVNKRFKNSFLELINFMDKKGYRLFEITDMNRPFKTEVLWLVELAFIKINGAIDSFIWN